ncbi:MAG: molybdopterin-dependent oxidoreductase [Acidimicrobiales bacterium]|jgi:formate dehydrogenase|nr:molybdopterin-dependent oxidoreductase [Acidimicrobiales bacterium]
MTDTAATDSTEPIWHQTACNLCSINCGVEIKLADDGRTFARVRGDKANPASLGYTCEKALRLDHYQNGPHRLTSPMRRTADGSYEEIDWDTAIREVAAGLAKVRDEHGGETIFYYGGGGQGNHLPGGYSGGTRKALGMKYSSNALAQEKTGEFWVDGQLFGAMSCHTTPDMEHTACAVFLGKNPWHSHGIPRARTVIKEIANDPDRTLIIIDPRVTESAELADIHLQVRPGGDAWLLGAMLTILLTEDLADRGYLAERANRLDDLEALLADVDLDEWADKAGIPLDEIRTATRTIAEAESCAIFEDLGIQMAPHSTLNSWLEKLIFIITGNFGVKGGMNLHTAFGKLAGGGGGGTRLTPVGEHRILSGLMPCNGIPDEILTTHPDRLRAAFVESSNPVHSLADSPRWREAFEALEFSVVVDVAMTETGLCADYVLPASSQYEKAEATFFTLEFPENYFHLRPPLVAPLEGTLPEPEIHRRLCRELGAYSDDDLAPLHEAAAEGLDAYAAAFFDVIGANPDLGKFLPSVLYETLGPVMPEGMESAAAVWGLAQTFVAGNAESAARAGYTDGNQLFDAIITSPSGVAFSSDPYDVTWERMRYEDKKINLVVDELVDEFRTLADEDSRVKDDQFPFILAAGERRSSTANTAMRDPEWRRKHPTTGLRLCTEDAEALGVEDGAKIRIVTKRGETVSNVEISDSMRPGHISLPNGQGLSYPDADPEIDLGVSPNELTSIEDRDWFAGTPHHKHVRARLERV